MKKWAQIIPYIIFLMFFIIIIVFGLVISDDTSKIRLPSANTFEEVYYEGSIIQIPTTLAVDTEEEFVIETTLDEDFSVKQTLLFRTSLQNLTVRLDGDILYQINYEDKFTYASMWHFVDIPTGSEGKTLTVEFSTPYSAMSGVVNPIFYGDFGGLMKEIIFSYGYRLLIGLLTFATGFALMVSGLFLYRNQNKPNVYLGLFAIFLGIWMVSESRMMQLFTGDIFVIGSLSYIALTLLPIPLFGYLLFHVQKKFHLYFFILIGVFALYTPLIMILEYLDIYDYFQSVLITQVLLVISMVTTISIIVVERITYKNEQIKEMFDYLIVFAIFGVLEIVVFFRSDFSYTSYFMAIGIAIIMLMILYNYIQFLIMRFKIGYENEFYQYLAYNDPITDAKNRLAYEQDFDRFFEDGDMLDTLRLLYFDLDNLKHINDVYGHLEGDAVIKEGYNIIKQTFGQYGTVYRIGGDEFACLVTSLDHLAFEELKKEFEELVLKSNDEKEYHFGLSIGSSIYDEHDQTPEDLVERADQLMYEYKRKTKKERDERSK